MLLQHQIQQHAISHFLSNIDAHLLPPGRPLINTSFLQSHLLSNLTPFPPIKLAIIPQLHNIFFYSNKQPSPIVSRREIRWRYRWPTRMHGLSVIPISSVASLPFEDACERLLPYHVVADYEGEEEDRILESDTTGQILSRSQQWDQNVAAKVAEFTATFEKQVAAFNTISHKLKDGEFKSEERLMINQALLQEERKALLEARSRGSSS